MCEGATTFMILDHSFNVFTNTFHLSRRSIENSLKKNSKVYLNLLSSSLAKFQSISFFYKISNIFFNRTKNKRAMFVCLYPTTFILSQLMYN